MNTTRTLLLASTMLAAAANAAMAQTTSGASTPTSQSAATSVEEVVVTGTRIRRSEFTSASPLTVITAEQASAEGVINTTEILQGSTVATSARQIDNEFTGFVTAGGPGANTLSLRGLGAQRTLILVNGKRVSPAGTRGQVGAVDLNTLPGTIVDRIDILKDGASSIYGSDAVAGVVNIITKEKLDGFSISVAGNKPQHEGGEQYRIGASAGKVWDRGYLNASVERFEQMKLTVGQRPDLGCAQDYFYNSQTGLRADLTYPNGEYVCFGSASGVYTRNADTARFVYDPTAVQNGNADPTLAINLNGYRRVNLSYTNLVPSNATVRAGYNAALFGSACPTTAGNADLTDPTCVNARIALARASQAAYPQNDPIALGTTAISPVKRTSLYFTGGYDITDNIKAFGELLLNRRESNQIAFGQIFNNVQGCANLISTATCKQNPTNPFPFIARTTLLVPRNNDQTVDYIRAVAGLNGDLTFADRKFHWEVYGVHGDSDAKYGGDFTYADRVNAIVSLTGTPSNIVCDANLIKVSDGGPDVNVRDGNQACVPVNVFRNDLVVPNGGSRFTDAERAFLFGYEVGKTKYTQDILEASITGDVFDLPAGPLGVALGLNYRKDKINDTPGFNARNNNYSGQTTSGITKGSDEVKEGFVEVDAPLLKDFPLVRSLDLSASYRTSDYKSYGKNDTYKLGLNWQVVDWLRFRATKGTSFRAPSLYELYLSNQTGFSSQANVDPCANTSSSNNATLQANCDAALTAVGVPASRLRTFTSPGGSATVLTGGGGVGVLKPETSDAVTYGVIFTPKFIDLRVAVDYTELEVNNEVAQFGAASIVSTCYRSTNYPNEPLCQLFTRSNNPQASNFQGIDVINNSYVNVANQRFRSIDLTAQYNHAFDWARMRVDFQSSWALAQKRQTLGQAVRDFNGEVLDPDFVGNGSVRFDRGPWRATYSFDLVGKASDSEVTNDFARLTSRGPNATTPNLPPELVQTVSFINNADFRDYHHVSVRYAFDDDTTLTVGVRNIFDSRPPVYSASGNETRIGSALLSSQYDLIGRRFFFELNKRWLHACRCRPLGG